MDFRRHDGQMHGFFTLLMLPGSERGFQQVVKAVQACTVAHARTGGGTWVTPTSTPSSSAPASPGMYMNVKLRDEMGLRVQVFEAGDDVGGTWYWNRYPGARCDSESYIYCYSFDKDLMQEWEWSGKYPEQPEILRYLTHVADRHDVRRNTRFNTRVTAMAWDELAHRWTVETDQGDAVTARFVITAVGCLSSTQVPSIPGLDSFEGDWYHTGQWPHDGVDFTGKRVGIIGTGSSGVQSIPVIARSAGHLTVFQRTPQYAIPARHGTVDKAFLDDVKTRYDDVYEQCRRSLGGQPYQLIDRSALSVDDDERDAIYEAGWQEGGFKFIQQRSTTSPSTGGPTTPPPSSSAARSARRWPTRRWPRSWCPSTTRSARSGR